MADDQDTLSGRTTSCVRLSQSSSFPGSQAGDQGGDGVAGGGYQAPGR